MYRLLLIAAAAIAASSAYNVQPRMPAARAVATRAAAPAMANPWENEGFFSGEEGRQGQWGLGFQTPSYFDGSIFNVITPTTVLALSPLILLLVFLGTVVFGIPGWDGQMLISELGFRGFKLY